MTTRHSTGIFIPLIILATACTPVFPDPSEGTSAGSSGDMHDNSSDPTEGSGGAAETSTPDDETSGGSGEAGDPPVVCNPADDFEPNDFEDEAKPVPNITDEDSAGEHLESILAGERDVDWFAYMGSDTALAYVDPASGIDADMEVRLCLFAECVNGPTKPFTCLDSIYDESPELTLPGCCNTGGSTAVSIDLYCDAGGDESAYIFMRVDQGTADICVPYEITYHF